MNWKRIAIFGLISAFASALLGFLVHIWLNYWRSDTFFRTPLLLGVICAFLVEVIVSCFSEIITACRSGETNKVKVITPEALLGMKEPKEQWHYGHCDRCHDPDYPLVFHFGYNKQTEPYGGSFRICRKCLIKLKKTLYPKWEKLSQKELETRLNKIFQKAKKE